MTRTFVAMLGFQAFLGDARSNLDRLLFTKHIFLLIITVKACVEAL